MYVNEKTLPWSPTALKCVVARKKTGKIRKKTSRPPPRAPAPRTKAGQREATRRRLIALAREEFTKHGYAGVGTARLVARAKLSRGALYHQFTDKQDLFRAVLEDAQAEIVAAIEAAVERSVAEHKDPGEAAWAALRLGCRAFLDAASQPERSRILLIDGPAVLGWDEWRRIDYENGVKELILGIQALIDAGLITRRPVDALAYMLSGAMNEGALWIASVKDRKAALRDACATMDALLEGLKKN